MGETGRLDLKTTQKCEEYFFVILSLLGWWKRRGMGGGIDTNRNVQKCKIILIALMFVFSWSVNLIWNSNCHRLYQWITWQCDIKVHPALGISSIYILSMCRRVNWTFVASLKLTKIVGSIICLAKFLLNLLFQFVEVAWSRFCIIHADAKTKCIHKVKCVWMFDL